MKSKRYKVFHQESVMRGPFALDIDGLWSAPFGTGVYVLLMEPRMGSFRSVYVGRSTCLFLRLLSHLGKADKFVFLECSGDYEAFEQECRLFHYYGKCPKLDNAVHPARPAGVLWGSPLCSERGCKGEPD